MTVIAVPCEGADLLALFDDDGTPLGEIAVGSHPVHATVIAGRVYVATMGERSITVVDRDGEVARIATGVLGPAHIVSAGDRVLVPCTASDAVAVIDARRASLEGRVPTGAEPHDVAVIEGGAIAGSRTDGYLTLFDPISLAVKARLEVPDPATARLQGVDTPVGDAHPSSAYVVDQGNDRVLLVGSDGVRAAANVGAEPYEATVTHRRAYVPARGTDTVHEFDPELTEAVVHDTATEPEGVVIVNGEPWVFHRGSPEIRTLGGRSVSIPAPALAATGLPDGRVLLSHYDDHAISLVDPASGDVAWTAETPEHPFGSVVV